MTIGIHRGDSTHADVWAQLAAPLPAGTMSWRQDGRPIARDNKYFSRFVAYIDAGTVRERLDAVVPGEWNLTLELLPAVNAESESFSNEGACAFKARLQVLGVVREDVGVGKDYKQASTDAFKRAAVRFGIGHELYQLGQNWVQMDGDGKYAKPVEDPQVAYDRRHSNAGDSRAAVQVGHEKQDNGRQSSSSQDNGEQSASTRGPAVASDVPPCPKCGGRMWDNRVGKKNPHAPDFKCRDRSCDGVIWPPKEKDAKRSKSSKQAAHSEADASYYGGAGDDEIPF